MVSDHEQTAVLCRHCEAYENACRYSDGTMEIRPGPPPGCEATIRLRVLSLEPDCWNCDSPALCLAGLHPDKPSPSYWGLFTCDDDETIELARVLADQHGHQDITRRLKRCFSDFQQDWLWANSCRDCGAVFDDLWFGEQIHIALASGGMEALQVLTMAECPSEAGHGCACGAASATLRATGRPGRAALHG
jgi:hypothetical protein